MIRKKAVWFFLVLLILFADSGVYPDVKIVRKLPDNATNTVDASWSAPKTDIERESKFFGKPELSGRFALGGSWGMDSYGEQKYDFFTDSNLSYLQPLGSVWAFQLTATALRKNIIGGLSQKYGGGFVLKGPDLSFVFKGDYDDNIATTNAVLNEDEKYNIDASINIGYLDTLPIVLGYSHSFGKKTEDQSPETPEDTVTGENLVTDKANLEIAGSIGSFGLNVVSAFQDNNDILNDVRSISFSNSVSILSPSLGIFRIRSSVSPDYSKVNYSQTSNVVETLSLDTELGVSIPVNDALAFDIYGGRIDTWLTREGSDAGTEGTDYLPKSAAWTGGTSVAYKNEKGLQAQSEYKAKGGAGLFDHSVDISGSYKGEEDTFLKNVELSGTFSQSYGTDHEINNDALNWSAGLGFSPADKMLFSASYKGSASASGDFSNSFTSWTHTGDASFSHTPGQVVDYQLSAALTDSVSESSSILKQQYGGIVNIKPQWGLKKYLFGLGEDAVISKTEPANSGNTVPDSQAVIYATTYTMGIPVTSFMRARYNLKWECTDDTGIVTGASAVDSFANNFQHLFGISLSGSPLPLSVTVDYLLNHGYRGLRQDVNSTLSIPLWGPFSVEGRFSLSCYTEGGVEKLPFLLGINAAYQF